MRNDDPHNPQVDSQPSDHARRLDALLDQALDLGPEARDSLLRRVHQDDPLLGDELRRLVEFALAEAPLLDQPGPAWQLLEEEPGNEERAPDGSTGPQIGSTIGAWRLVEPLGSGGMARVYLAERDDATYSQRAALKILRWELQSPESERRFSVERQILADLEHPSIARILDGGVTEGRLPWFAMEWIDGVPIHRYCAEQGLALDQRIELFLDVCRAAGHAHNRLIVHRDIKPSNILVPRDGRARLLDFGIAKDLDPDAEAGDPTRYSLGTPRYSAPEQVRGERLSPAADVWALGALLFELLTGSQLFEGGDASQLYQRVLTEEIEPASVRARRVEGSPVPPSRIEGELDLIIGKALAREPSERYANAAELAEDLERFLSSRPIRAMRPSSLYVAKKFLRRNRLALSIAAVAAASVLTLTILFTQQLLHERDTARQQSQKAEQTKNFLVDLFLEADPAINQGRELTSRQLLERGRERLDRELASDPLLAAEMNVVLGSIYSSLGEPEIALDLMATAVDLARSASESETTLLAQSLNGHADALRVLGRYDEAEEKAREALRVTQAVESEGAPEIALALNQLGLLLAEKGDSGPAIELLREGLRQTRRTLGDHEYTARLMSNLGLAIKWSGDFEQAETLYRDALAMRRRVLPENHPDIMVTLDNLGVLLGQSGRFDESEATLREGLERRIEVFGPDHPDVALNLNNLASLFLAKGDLAQAETVLERAVKTNEEVFGPDSLRTATNLCNLANLRNRRALGSDALPLWERCLNLRRTHLGEQHRETASALRGRAEARLLIGDLDAALADAQLALELVQQVTADGALVQLQNATTLAEAFYRSGQFSRAETVLRASLEAAEALAQDHSSRLTAQLILGLVQQEQGATTEAAELFRQSLPALEGRFNDQNIRLHRLMANAKASLQPGSSG